MEGGSMMVLPAQASFHSWKSEGPTRGVLCPLHVLVVLEIKPGSAGKFFKASCFLLLAKVSQMCSIPLIQCFRREVVRPNPRVSQQL